MKRKGIAVLVLLTMMLTMLPGASLAYLVDSAEPINNRVCFPSLEIELTETLWDPDDEHLLTPGSSYDKNPVTTLKSGSVASYVFMEVTCAPALFNVLNGKTETASGSTLYYYPSVNPAWQLMADYSTDNKRVYKYTGVLATFDGQCSEDIPLPALFDKIQVKPTASNADVQAAADAAGLAGTVDITVKSHAVQQAGFSTAEAAYAAAYGN